MSKQTVIDFSQHQAKRRRRRAEKDGEPFPDPLPLGLAVQILRLARKDGFSFNEVRFATRSVEYWAQGGGGECKIVLKFDWPRTVANAMRLGWGLRNFANWQKRNRTKAWMDKPLRAFDFDDLVECITRRRAGDRSYVPRKRDEQEISDSRLT